MVLLIASFLAGVLTSLAPCILPLLPVIVGSSILPGSDRRLDRRKPYIIAASLAVSVIAFTLLLKATSLLIGVDPKVWTVLAGIIVVLLGIVMLFPDWWVRMSAAIGFEQGSNQLLAKAGRHSGVSGAILTGAALGPVFSSCSPVYALVLATVLPVNFALGLAYMTAYALGLALALLAIALLGRRLTTKLGWAVNPNGMFRKVLAVILIAVGLLVALGYNDRFQTWAADHLPFVSTSLEEKLIPGNGSSQPDVTVSTNKKNYGVDPYPAPDFANITSWINSDPLIMQQLRGKVVLIDFWTYSCINCQRTQPYLNKWYDRYHDKGLVIVGVHAPEFAFEKVPANVRNAVKEEGIKYPVALDNDFATWGAYRNRYWPAKYLIDKDGLVRYTKFGEGDYDKTERVIQDLLKESGHAVTDKVDDDSGSASVQYGQTPETYLGYERGQRFANVDQFFNDKAIRYTLASDLNRDEWSLGGTWRVGAMQTKALDDGNVLRIKFSAKEVYLVMDGPSDRPVTLKLDGRKVVAATVGGADVDAGGNVWLDGPRLYKLIKLPSFDTNRVLDIRVPNGTIVNAFTFGG